MGKIRGHVMPSLPIQNRTEKKKHRRNLQIANEWPKEKQSRNRTGTEGRTINRLDLTVVRLEISRIWWDGSIMRWRYRQYASRWYCCSYDSTRSKMTPMVNGIACVNFLRQKWSNIGRDKCKWDSFQEGCEDGSSWSHRRIIIEFSNSVGWWLLRHIDWTLLNDPHQDGRRWCSICSWRISPSLDELSGNQLNLSILQNSFLFLLHFNTDLIDALARMVVVHRDEILLRSIRWNTPNERHSMRGRRD